MAENSHNSIDQKIRDLERELRLVQGDVKSLTKAVHDPRQKPLPKVKSGRIPLPGDAPNEPEVTAVPEYTNEEEPVKSPSQPADGPPRRTPQRPSPSAGEGRDYRFATYMSAKGLSYGKASRHERNIQRNKAVVMLVVVLLVLYVVLQLSS